MKKNSVSKRGYMMYLIILCMVFPGCATVKIYSDPALTQEAGLRYYTLRPYLLVEYMTGDKTGVRSTVIYLPDLSSPQYLVFRPGLGSADIKMTFENSALKSYGVVSESQVPELLESFAAMLSKGAYAAQTFANEGGDTSVEAENTFRLYEIIFDDGITTLREVNIVGGTQR